MQNSETNKIIKAAGSIAGATLLSRILGFVRDMIVARFFGATASADSFYVAYRIPNLLRELFAEGTMSAAFVPVFTEYLESSNREEARKLASGMLTALLSVVSIVVLLGILFAPYLVLLIAPGFRVDPAKFSTTVFMTRIMFPYLLFISLASLTMGMLNSLRIFFVPAFTPVILNIFIISMIIILAPMVDPPVSAAAYGVLFGGIFQLLFQIPFLKKESMLFGFSSFLSHPGVKKIFRLMGPVVAGLSVTQVNLLVNTILASFLAVGSVSFLYYGMRLIHFPLGILGVAIATAILPSFSTLAANKDYQELNKTLCFGLRLVLFITVPAMLGLIFYRIPIINLLFQHGQFDFNATIGTSGAVLFYALGLWSFACVRIVTQAFYSLQDTKTPMKAAVFSVLSGIILSLMLIPYLEHRGLALATSLASMINLFILIRGYPRLKELRFGEIIQTTGKSITSAIPIILSGLFISSYYSWQGSDEAGFKAAILALFIGGSGLIYFLAHYFLRSPELLFLLEHCKKKK